MSVFGREDAFFRICWGAKAANSDHRGTADGAACRVLPPSFYGKRSSIRPEGLYKTESPSVAQYA